MASRARAALGKWFCYLLFILCCQLAHAQGKVTYIYTDPQGTPLAEADAAGNITATYDYTPYGTAVTSMSPAPNGPGYTGHVNDPDTGLVYMQQRYFDPATGRFLSADPVVPSAGNSFNFNRYAYGNNNPVRNVDPDGRQIAGTVNNDNVDWDQRAKANVELIGYLLTGQNIDSVNAPGDDSIQSVVTPFEFGGASRVASVGEWGISKLASAGESFFAKAAVQDLGSSSFFQGTSYTPKVMQQMSQGPGEFHSFSESVTAFESSGTVSSITGGDGALYQKLEIPGSYTTPGSPGSPGTTYGGNFQFIKDGDGNINHRLFVPDKSTELQ